jgi:hypothetical protein
VAAPRQSPSSRTASAVSKGTEGVEGRGLMALKALNISSAKSQHDNDNDNDRCAERTTQ